MGDRDAVVIRFPVERTTEPYVTIREVAAHLGMSVSWVEKAVVRGLPSHKLGRARRFRLSEVEQWLAQ